MNRRIKLLNLKRIANNDAVGSLSIGRCAVKSVLAFFMALLVLPARATIQVYVGFADTTRPASFFPNPWQGSASTTFFGAPGTANFYHSAAILIYNSGSTTVTLSPGAFVDGFGNAGLRYQLWDALIGTGTTIAPGKKLILTQTAAPANASNFDPTQDSLSMTATPPSPVVHLTVDGSLVTYTDSAHVMVIGGSDWNANFNRNESLQWRPIGTFGASIPAGTGVNPQAFPTWHGDVTRQGATPYETSLTPSNVTPNTFGYLFQYSVDGQVYGQPLYVPNVAISNKGIHNVVYVATSHNSVYAFDADQPGTGAPLWKFNAGPSVPASDLCAGDQYPEYGITSTPVIDVSRQAIYFVANTKTGPTTYASTLHALDLRNGAEKLGGPSVIQASVKGTGEGGDGNGNVIFDPLNENQRSALLLWNGVIYIGYGSHCDVPPFHGWLLGYSAANIKTQTCVFNTTPDATTVNGLPGGGSIWMTGGGPSTDGSAMYFTTSNGTFDIDKGGRDYSDSILKLVPSAGTLSVVDTFTPSNQDYLNQQDLDFGSSAPLLMKPVAGVTVPLLVQTTKTGRVFILNRNTGSMGGYHATDQIWKESGDYTVPGGAWGNPASAYGTVYFGGSGGTMRGFSFVNGKFIDQSFSETTAKFIYPGLSPSVSMDSNAAKLTQNVIVWGTENFNGQAVLHAFAGNDLHELYSGIGAPYLDGYVKFTSPTVAAGKVYVAGAHKVTVYGGSWFTPAPTISVTPVGLNAKISMSTTLPGGVIRYSLNGSDPVATSPTYTAPFTTTVSRTVKAQVFAPQFQPGKIASQVVVAGTSSIAIRCGGVAVGTFQTDGFYTNGLNYSVTTPVSTVGVSNAAPQAVYQWVRWGEAFSYVFTGLRTGISYQVRLHFAEIYNLYAGMRVFNVTINGVPSLTNFDILADAGGPNKADVKTFTVPPLSGTGTIQIDFQGVVDNAKVSGIEIFPAPTGIASPRVESIMRHHPDPTQALMIGQRPKPIKRELNGLTMKQRAAIQRAYRCHLKNIPLKDRWKPSDVLVDKD